VTDVAWNAQKLGLPGEQIRPARGVVWGFRLGAALQHVQDGIRDGVPAQQVNLGRGRRFHREIRGPDRMPIEVGSPVFALEGVAAGPASGPEGMDDRFAAAVRALDDKAKIAVRANDHPALAVRQRHLGDGSDPASLGRIQAQLKAPLKDAASGERDASALWHARAVALNERDIPPPMDGRQHSTSVRRLPSPVKRSWSGGPQAKGRPQRLLALIQQRPIGPDQWDVM
jgi:hypothetical protein